MTGSFSVAEVRAVLAAVCERLDAAYQCTSTAQTHIGDAIAVLTELGRDSSEQLLPDDLIQADEELARGLAMISGGVSAVAAIDARL